MTDKKGENSLVYVPILFGMREERREQENKAENWRFLMPGPAMPYGLPGQKPSGVEQIATGC